MKNEMTNVRNLLIETMERLVQGEEEGVRDEDRMTVEKAQQISNIGNVLISSAKVEVDFIKATGGKAAPTGFLGEQDVKQLGNNSQE